MNRSILLALILAAALGAWMYTGRIEYGFDADAATDPAADAAAGTAPAAGEAAPAAAAANGSLSGPERIRLTSARR